MKKISNNFTKLFCILVLQLLLVSCADVEPAPVEPVVEEPAMVEEDAVEIEEPAIEEEIFYTQGGSKVRSEIFDKNIYYGELADIPIPYGMNRNNRFSEINKADGVAQGIEVYTGKFNLEVLGERMKENMYDHFWNLKSAEVTTDGSKITQVYEQDNRIVLIHLSKRIVDLRLEVWAHLADAEKTSNSSYIPPTKSDTNPENRKDLLPSSIKKANPAENIQ